jgi:hypothetical protein
MAAARWARRKLAGEGAIAPEHRRTGPSHRDPPARDLSEAEAAPARELKGGEAVLRGGADAGGRGGRPDEESGPGNERDRKALLAERRAQIGRISRAREDALAAGDVRRVARLAHRAERVRAEAEDLETPERRRRSDQVRPRETGAAVEHLGVVGRGARSNDSAGTAPEQLSNPRSARTGPKRPAGVARSDLDREIVHRRDQLALRQASERPGGRPGAVESPRQSSGREGGGYDASRAPSSPGAIPRRRPGESSVMRDIREVEAGRKRQLGRERP